MESMRFLRTHFTARSYLGLAWTRESNALVVVEACWIPRDLAGGD